MEEQQGKEITPPDSVVPIYLNPTTEAELAERTVIFNELAEREKAQTDRQVARDSALSKLEAIGLTPEEIQAITN